MASCCHIGLHRNGTFASLQYDLRDSTGNLPGLEKGVILSEMLC